MISCRGCCMPQSMHVSLAGCSAPACLWGFSSFLWLPAWCGRSGAEGRMPAGRLKRKQVCKGRAKGVFSWSFMTTSPWGHFPSAHLAYCTRIIHSFPATPGECRPVLDTPQLFQYPAPFPPCCEGMQPRRWDRWAITWQPGQVGQGSEQWV